MLKSILSFIEYNSCSITKIFFEENSQLLLSKNITKYFFSVLGIAEEFLDIDIVNKYQDYFCDILMELFVNFETYSFNEEKSLYDGSFSLKKCDDSLKLVVTNIDHDPLKYIVYDNGRLVLKKASTPLTQSGSYYKIIFSQDSLFCEGDLIDHLSISHYLRGLYKEYAWLSPMNKKGYAVYCGEGNESNVPVENYQRGSNGLGMIEDRARDLQKCFLKDFNVEIDVDFLFNRSGSDNLSVVRTSLEIRKV